MRSATETLQAAILERCTPEPNSGCWLWLLVTDRNGYGRLYVGNDRRITAQRASYMAFKGNIPSGYQIDHLCRVRSCVNPAHLEAVTPQVNVLRGVSPMARQAKQTHCARGHALEGDNLYSWDGDGHRHCKICQAETSRRHYLKNREKIIARTRANERRRAAEREQANGGSR